MFLPIVAELATAIFMLCASPFLNFLFDYTAPGSLSRLLHSQVIFKGTADRSLPQLKKRAGARFNGWLWGYTDNHWSNFEEQKKLVRLVIAPFFQRKIKELGLPEQQKAIHLIDCWPCQISVAYRSWMKEQYPWILVLYVPPSCTSKLQPQDKFYQKPFKHATMAAFLDFQLKTYR